MRQSAGLLLYRRRRGSLEVLLVHMGGPFWAHRDAGAWSIPKGEHDSTEEPLAAARREFGEETGLEAPPEEALDLGEARQSSGKRVRAFAIESDLTVGEISSNTFELEWPRRSGQLRSFPEVDRAQWFELDAARERIVKGQLPLLDALRERLAGGQ